MQATQEVGLHTFSNTGWSEYDLTYNSQPTGQRHFIASQPVAVGDEWYNWTIPLDRFVNNKTCLVLNIIEQTDSSVSIWFRSKETIFDFDRPHIHVYFAAGAISGYSLLVAIFSLLVILSISKAKKKKLQRQ